MVTNKYMKIESLPRQCSYTQKAPSGGWGVGRGGRDARREGQILLVLFLFPMCSHKFPRDFHQALKRFPKFPMCSLKCSNNFTPDSLPKVVLFPPTWVIWVGHRGSTPFSNRKFYLGAFTISVYLWLVSQKKVHQVELGRHLPPNSHIP